MQGSGFRVKGLGFGVWGPEFRGSGLGGRLKAWQLLRNGNSPRERIDPIRVSMFIHPAGGPTISENDPTLGRGIRLLVSSQMSYSVIFLLPSCPAAQDVRRWGVVGGHPAGPTQVPELDLSD